MKVLLINSCSDCPYLGITVMHDSDDSYLAKCNNPDIEPFKWVNKIKNRSVDPPPRCPLSDISEYTNNDY